MADNYTLETINVEGKAVLLTDKQLTNRFNAEVTNRTNADTKLDNKINTEITNRTNADKSLDTKINTEVTNRTNAISELKTTLSSHINNKSNPHNVTKSQIGLSNVDNVSKSAILLSAYPVGSIYMSVNNTSPASLFGGTWEQLKDRFLIGAGNSYTVNKTGGETGHKHNYGIFYNAYFGTIAGGDNLLIRAKDYPSDTAHNAGKIEEGKPILVNSSITASTKTINATTMITEATTSSYSGLPPYLAVYMWKRTA